MGEIVQKVSINEYQPLVLTKQSPTKYYRSDNEFGLWWVMATSTDSMWISKIHIKKGDPKDLYLEVACARREPKIIELEKYLSNFDNDQTMDCEGIRDFKFNLADNKHLIHISIGYANDNKPDFEVGIEIDFEAKK